MSDFQIITKVLSPLYTNCYFIYNEQTGETIIVDPAENAALIQNNCREMELMPVAVLLTHGHFDHVAAAENVKKAFQIPIYAGIAEKELLASPYLNCSRMINKAIEITADHWLADQETLDSAGFHIKVITTPGHTSGSVCYYIEKENVLISGDTLFKNGFGRTDLPTGSQSAISHSIIQKLFVLPDHTTVYPGHGDRTTIAHEKQNNMILT